ncbi:MAG: hypothetical protein JW963_08690 [Anaerolineales bacterium]|nr:hypothetical protein [Anaerolineales bacterium]
MISKLLDWLSNFLAHRKGLLPLTGIVLVILNYLLQWLIYPHWLAASNLFLHLGIVVAIFGLMLAWAL